MSRNAPAPIIVVSDTGPLLSAFQCGRIDLLRRYFKQVYIPASAIQEFKRHNAGDNLRELIEDGLIVVEHLTVTETEKAEQIARAEAVGAFCMPRYLLRSFPKWRNRRPSNTAQSAQRQKATPARSAWVARPWASSHWRWPTTSEMARK